MRFSSYEHYMAELSARAALPEGFRVGTVPVSFFPEERESKRPYVMSMSLILADEPTSCFAGVFTRNAFPGAPVILGRRRLSGPRARGIVVNNRIANVCAPGGVDAAERILREVAARAGGKAEEYFPASTGIIGWRLPLSEMTAAVPALAESAGQRSLVDVAKAIMTTDAFPKLRSAPAGAGRVVGVAKGAGMIEPNMATMLAFILTDCRVERSELREMLGRCVDASFNAISVDGDQSTSDTVLVLSSGSRGAVDPGKLERSLLEVCRGLSEDIVRNGEGVGHVLKVSVTGAPDAATARGVAKGVANSLLVKTAVYGNDPNVGRLIGAVGDYLGGAGVALDARRVRVSLCGEEVFRDGAFALSPALERKLADSLRAASMPTEGRRYPPHEERVEIRVELGSGAVSAEVLGADLSYDYVKENADYRS